MHLLHRLFHRSPQPIGRRGEQAAATWLRRRGYRILERNLPLAKDEADVVALDPDGRTIVIVEVKSRAGDGQTHPEIAITPTKQFHLARLASRLQQSADYQGRPFRFDAIGVVFPPQGKPIVRHTAGAFESPW